MGRHSRDDEPITERITGPFRRVRQEADTEPIPDEETTRKAWPIMVILGVAFSAAVGIPTGLFRTSADRPTPDASPAVSLSLSAEDTPSPTPAAKPKPRATRTIRATETVTSPPKVIISTAPAGPVPTVTITVKKTIKPKPRPTITITEERIIERCFGVWRGGAREEIECP